MSLCVVCGYSTPGPESICTHHAGSYPTDWAEANKLMCDLLHRGIVSRPPSLRTASRTTNARDESRHMVGV
jgi:hypothetical protein